MCLKTNRKHNDKKYNKQNRKDKRKTIIISVMSFILLVAVAFTVYKMTPLGNNKASDDESYKDKLQDYIKDNDDYLTQGNKDSKVQVVSFVDFRCSHCSDYNREIKQSKIQPKIDSGEIGYTQIALPVVDSISDDYADMYKIFNRQGDVDLSEQFSKQAFETSTIDNDPVKTVEKMKLPKDKEKHIIKSYENTTIKGDKDKIKSKLKVVSTPTIFVNSHHVRDAKNLKDIVDEKLEGKD